MKLYLCLLLTLGLATPRAYSAAGGPKPPKKEIVYVMREPRPSRVRQFVRWSKALAVAGAAGTLFYQMDVKLPPSSQNPRAELPANFSEHKRMVDLFGTMHVEAHGEGYGKVTTKKGGSELAYVDSSGALVSQARRVQSTADVVRYEIQNAEGRPIGELRQEIEPVGHAFQARYVLSDAQGELGRSRENPISSSLGSVQIKTAAGQPIATFSRSWMTLGGPREVWTVRADSERLAPEVRALIPQILRQIREENRRFQNQAEAQAATQAAAREAGPADAARSPSAPTHPAFGVYSPGFGPLPLY